MVKKRVRPTKPSKRQLPLTSLKGWRQIAEFLGQPTAVTQGFPAPFFASSVCLVGVLFRCRGAVPFRDSLPSSVVRY